MPAAANGDASGLRLAPDPENPGWLNWQFAYADEHRFNREVMGKMLLRRDDNTHARLRLFPVERHLNPMGNIHGGIIMSSPNQLATSRTDRMRAPVTLRMHASGAARARPRDRIVCRMASPCQMQLR